MFNINPEPDLNFSQNGDRIFFIAIIIIIVLVAGYFIYSYQSELNKYQYYQEAQLNDQLNNQLVDQLILQEQQIQQIQQNQQPNILVPLVNPIVEEKLIPMRYDSVIQPTPRELVRTYDINTLENPYVPPTSRPPGYIFGPTLLNPLFYESTHGPLDDFSYVGNLFEIKDSHSKYGDGGRILRVMGRQRYPNGNWYDYYVLVPQDDLSIKIDIRTKKHDELYDGDEVVIPELGDKLFRFKKNKSYFNQFY